jgi:hypothetical protein
MIDQLSSMLAAIAKNAKALSSDACFGCTDAGVLNPIAADFSESPRLVRLLGVLAST